MPVRAGDEAFNPATESRWRVLETDMENGGAGFSVEVQCQPGQDADIAEHFHTGWTERFEILSGAARYRLDGTAHEAGPGDSIVFLPNRRHVHPWAAGDAPMTYRQVTRFAHADPRAAQETLGVFLTLFALAGEGRTDARGLPKNPLRAAVVLRTLARHGGYDASVPVFVQKFAAATLGAVGAALGYRAVDERLLGE